MTLTYRGVKYKENKPQVLTLAAKNKNKNIIYRGNSLKARINPKFPWWQYIRQLFDKSEAPPILDPITFWYNHKRQFLDDIWCQDDLEKLDRCWDLTLKTERTQTVKSQHKTQLKYRGVTYYR